MFCQSIVVVHQDLPAVIRFLDREINLNNWLIRVDPDLVRDVLLVRRDSHVTELNRSAGCCLRYSTFATWRHFNLSYRSFLPYTRLRLSESPILPTPFLHAP